ncbi:MAG: hypothetical protein IJD42_04530 [Clostridia bacterium]|nr:hypothetical protein [Clostridia bacterium]
MKKTIFKIVAGVVLIGVMIYPLIFFIKAFCGFIKRMVELPSPELAFWGITGIGSTEFFAFSIILPIILLSYVLVIAIYLYKQIKGSNASNFVRYTYEEYKAYRAKKKEEKQAKKRAKLQEKIDKMEKTE